jgi:hypothetical protein
MTNTDSILNAALQLPESERWVIVDKLLESMPPGHSGSTMDDSEWLDELDRRAADPDEGIDWPTLRDED